MSGESIARVRCFAFLVLCVACFPPAEALAQGETTSAIVGEVRDTTNAVVPGVTVTITNHETGLKRTVQTDEAGRFKHCHVFDRRLSFGERTGLVDDNRIDLR